MPSPVSFSRITPPSNVKIICPICYSNQHKSTRTWIAHSKFHPAHEKCLKRWFQIEPMCPSCSAPGTLSVKERIITYIPSCIGIAAITLNASLMMCYSGSLPFIDIESKTAIFKCLMVANGLSLLWQFNNLAKGIVSLPMKQVIKQLFDMPVEIVKATMIGSLTGLGWGVTTGLGDRIYFYDRMLPDSDLFSIPIKTKLSIGISAISLLGFGSYKLYRIITETTERITKRVFQSTLINYELLHGN